MTSAGIKPISWQTSYGEPFVVNETVITPKAGALSIRLPFWGMVWNMPLAVKVADGQGEREIPIENSFLQSSLALAASAAVVLIFIRLLNRKR